jgi:hypothetical protein
MGAGKNKSHRKKRISKHVLEAEERKKQTQLEEKLISAAQGGETSSAAVGSPDNAKGSAKKKKETTISPNSKTKDPEEAASYLTLWNHDRNNKSASGAWKFNKNTQSWLLRHMYDSDKVSKTTFGLLIEYICLGGDGTRCRVEEDAKRRAIRYKEWEKEQSKTESGVEAQEQSEKSKGKSKSTDQLSEEEAWAELNDHDKRKSYKRARKVMDALKAVREKAASGAE